MVIPVPGNFVRKSQEGQTMITSSGDFCLSDALDENGNIELGVALPFGNSESEWLGRKDAVEIASHLIKTFSISQEELAPNEDP